MDTTAMDAAEGSEEDEGAPPLMASSGSSEEPTVSAEEAEHTPGERQTASEEPSPKRRKAPSPQQPPGPAPPAPAAEAPEAAAEAPAAELEGEAGAGEEERIWSAVVEIDPGFPFDAVWPTLRGSVFKALRSVHTTWPKMGWRSSEEMETSLRSGVETVGFGAVARGLQKAQAERVSRELRGEVPCSVRLDREGAAAAPDVEEPGPGPAGRGAEDVERRERIRRRIRGLRDRAGWRMPMDPMFADILGRIERDVEELVRSHSEGDRQWLAMAPAMERALDLMQAHEAVGHLLGGRLLRRGLCFGQDRPFAIGVERGRLLGSALWSVLAADPEDLRKGRLHVKYRGEEGEDGEGGGGVTRAFLTQAGRLLIDTRLGLLLPAPGGHVDLSPLPGFLSPPGRGDQESVHDHPQQWAAFLGRLLGMAVVHECPLGFLLTPSLCKQLLGQEPCFGDLRFAAGLNDSGSGWYSSLRQLLGGQEGDPVLGQLEASEVDQALSGLQAVMPGRAQLIFEALASHLGAAAGAPELREEALEMAARLLRAARTPAQRSRALEAASQALEAALRPPGGPGNGVLRQLRAALAAAGCQGPAAAHLEEMLCAAEAAAGPEAEEGEDEAPPLEEVAASPPSELRPLRPQHVPAVSDWLTAGAKAQMRSTGRLYHEVRLGDDFEDFFDPQIGWLTEHFAEHDYDANGVGDDRHGWAADGVRGARWHDGPADARWPRAWRGGDVVGLAVDIDAGQMRLSLNGEWVPEAQMSFEAAGRSLFPAVSMKGRFTMHIPRASWHFSPPDGQYDAWAESGVFTRPVQVASQPPHSALEQPPAAVEGPGLDGGADLSSANLQAFAEAAARKALCENLQPCLGDLVREFGRVVPQRLQRGLSWQQVQERISGQLLDPSAFVRAWRGKTTYQCCGEADRAVGLWWDYVSECAGEELRQVFSWCTGFAAIPVTAWRFQIRAVEDTGRCPTVNTCMTDDPSAANRGVKMPTLYLPAYDSKATLARRMAWAIAGAAAMHLH